MSRIIIFKLASATSCNGPTSVRAQIQVPPPLRDRNIEVKGKGIRGKDNIHSILSLHSFRSSVHQSINQGPCSL